MGLSCSVFDDHDGLTDDGPTLATIAYLALCGPTITTLNSMSERQSTKWLSTSSPVSEKPRDAPYHLNIL